MHGLRGGSGAAAHACSCFPPCLPPAGTLQQRKLRGWGTGIILNMNEASCWFCLGLFGRRPFQLCSHAHSASLGSELCCCQSMAVPSVQKVSVCCGAVGCAHRMLCPQAPGSAPAEISSSHTSVTFCAFPLSFWRQGSQLIFLLCNILPL